MRHPIGRGRLIKINAAIRPEMLDIVNIKKNHEEGEPFMSQMFISCPETGQPVYVGLNFEWLQLEAVEIEEATIVCPRCGGVHSWDKDDVDLRADGGG